MKRLSLFVIAILFSFSCGCTLRYPIVGVARGYNEVFRGTVAGSPWTGDAYVEGQALVSKVKCAGPTRVTFAPRTGSVSGQMGQGVLTCEDGRTINASYTITEHAHGIGIGKDQFGNEFTFSFGMSENEALQKTNEYLKTAASRPPLPGSSVASE